MNTALTPLLARTLAIATLAATAAAAHASGVTIASANEHLVTAGMTRDEVTQALGRPAMNEHFMNQPGATWTYEVPDQISQRTLFDVDFDAAGNVMSTSERVVDFN